MRWSEGDTVKFVSLLRIHFLTHNPLPHPQSTSSPTISEDEIVPHQSNYWFLQLNIRTVAQEPSQVEQYLNEKYCHEKNSSCLRDDAPATGEETVLVCVDTYWPTCLRKSNARLVTLTSTWYTRVKKNPSAWNFLSQTGNDVRYSCHHNSSRFTSPYLRIRVVSLSSIHYNQSHRVYLYINRRRQYICLIWN